MNMKRLLTLVAFFATLHASAQQVNPVPDYVFANRMSAGRNTVTDTAAYLSIGPRYGATRGMMPPMVVDTASFSANKRNGLLIFSVQKNKFLYWDSVGVKWAEMAGTGGSAITGSGVAGYMPEFTTTTNLDTTRLYHSAGRFAIGSTTTSNGVFNVYGGQSYFDTSLKVGTQTLFANESNNEVFVNTTTDAGDFKLQVVGNTYMNGILSINTSGQTRTISTFYASGTTGANIYIGGGGASSTGTGNQGSFNTSIGISALNNNTTGYVNTGIGYFALNSNLTGTDNTAIGGFAMQATTGSENTGVGSAALINLTTGIRNIAIGSDAGRYINSGSNNTTSDRSVYIGFDARASANGNTNEIVIGNISRGNGSNTVTIGNSSTTDNYFYGAIRTSAPTGGTSNAWRLGTVATVSPTSPNRTIEVSIGGTIYYIAAKTTND